MERFSYPGGVFNVKMIHLGAVAGILLSVKHFRDLPARKMMQAKAARRCGLVS